MPRKKFVPPSTDACAFCHKSDNHPLLGELLIKDGLRVHSNCIFAASGLSQEREDGHTDDQYVVGFHLDAIRQELRRGRSLSCSLCRCSGACVGCSVTSCPCSFHLPCITKAGGITVFEDPFPSYCKRHSPKQNLETLLARCSELPSCCVCLFSVLPEVDPKSRADKPKAIAKCSTPNGPLTATVERRLLRRSCMTVPTPKRICVAVKCDVQRFVESNSSWEIDGDLRAEAERATSHQPSQVVTSSKIGSWSLDNLPEWLAKYLSQFPAKRQQTAYESWAHNTIHGRCCPMAWMHRGCIAGYAVSAALHYLKCPYCSDKQTFIRSVIDAGVWVPDRDAAWELEPGAFADLIPTNSNGPTQETDSSDSNLSECSPSSSMSSGPCRTPRGRGNGGHRRGRLLSALPMSESNSKSVISLVWNNRQLGLRGRSHSAQPRGRPRRSVVPPMNKSSPEDPPRRTVSSRRRSMFVSRHTTFDSNLGLHTSENHRMRQSTLGSFLANFRVSSPS